MKNIPEGLGTEWVCGNYAARDVMNKDGSYYSDDEPPELARLPICNCKRGCKVTAAENDARGLRPRAH